MTITLDAATEEKFQKELERGQYADANELVQHLLAVMELASIPGPSQEDEDWLYENREAIDASLDVSFAQKERGESYSLEEVKAMLAEHRAARAA